MSLVEITNVTDVIYFSQMEEKEKNSLKIMLRQIELAEGFTETFYLEGVVLIDFIKKINIVKIKRKLFGVMNRKKNY